MGILAKLIGPDNRTARIDSPPALTADEQLALDGLRRVCRDRRPEDAPLVVGAVAQGRPCSVELKMLRRCRCGAPVSTAYFFGDTVFEAARAAKLFVEALTIEDDG